MGLQPKTAYDKIQLVVRRMMRVVADAIKAKADPEDISFYQEMLTMLTSATEELENVEAFIYHYKALQRVNIILSKQVDELQAEKRILELQIEGALHTAPMTSVEKLEKEVNAGTYNVQQLKKSIQEIKKQLDAKNNTTS